MQYSGTIVNLTNNFVETRIDILLATYAAFCRQYGDYATPAIGRHCWNDDAIVAMVSSMETPWDNLLQSYESAKDEIMSSIEDLFRQAEITGADGPQSASFYLDTNLFVASEAAIPADMKQTLLEALPNHEDQLLDDLTQLYDQLDQDLALVVYQSFEGFAH